MLQKAEKCRKICYNKFQYIFNRGGTDMIHIALCDDDKEYISLIKRIILEAGADSQTTFFLEYTSGKEFVFDLESGKECDLLILDMQLGDMDGDDIAKAFRERYPYATLVFCSGVQLPTVKSFKATPYRYLLKSYGNDEMMEEMKEILKEVRNRKEDTYIVGHYRYNSIKVKVNNIMYITNTKRGSRIFVTPECEEYGFEEQILVDEKLADLQRKYVKEGFEFASVSYIVNMHYVKQIKGNELILFTGERLAVTRSYYNEFRKKYTRNLAGKY